MMLDHQPPTATELEPRVPFAAPASASETDRIGRPSTVARGRLGRVAREHGGRKRGRREERGQAMGLDRGHASHPEPAALPCEGRFDQSRTPDMERPREDAPRGRVLRCAARVVRGQTTLNRTGPHRILQMDEVSAMSRT